jgi:hypothetical protein
MAIHKCCGQVIQDNNPVDDPCGFACIVHTHTDGTTSCEWSLDCGDGLPINGTVDTGRKHPKPLTGEVVVTGTLGAIASIFERMWRRPVSVPERRRMEEISRRLKGTPEELAEALGLLLG